jgi:hypothetical protein
MISRAELKSALFPQISPISFLNIDAASSAFDSGGSSNSLLPFLLPPPSPPPDEDEFFFSLDIEDELRLRLDSGNLASSSGIISG